MKKWFFSSFIAVLLLMSFKSNAGWDYCRQAVLIGTDTWNVYIHKSFSGPGPVYGVSPQFRYRYYDPSSGSYYWSNWQNLPSSGFIGISGPLYIRMTGEVEIRELNFSTEGYGVDRQFYVTSSC